MVLSLMIGYRQTASRRRISGAVRMRKWLVTFAIRSDDVGPVSKGKMSRRRGSNTTHCYRNTEMG